VALVEYGGGGANIWRANRLVRNATGLLVSNAVRGHDIAGIWVAFF